MKLSNESYFSLNFIARKRANKEGELPITLRITMNGQRAEIYVNRTVRPDDWNAAKDQSKGKTKKDLELNRYHDTVRTKICEMATMSLNNHVPIETISKMLGHSDISTTQIYARMLDQTISEDMERMRAKFDTMPTGIKPLAEEPTDFVPTPLPKRGRPRKIR